jgi:hypothetical protein
LSTQFFSLTAHPRKIESTARPEKSGGTPWQANDDSKCFQLYALQKKEPLMHRQILCISACAALFLGAASIVTQASAATINSNIPVGGTFDATLGGSGVANLTSASGTFRQWLGFFHTNINVSAGAQQVGLNIPAVNPGTMAASGNVDMDYDNVTPGTPQFINSFNADLNGATVIPFVINVGNLNINTSLGTFQLALTVNGNITDIDFNSTGGSPVIGGNGGLYDVPGDFSITLDANVVGVLQNVPIIGNVNLGTITSIPSTVLPFSASLPGFATTSDLDGGVGPFPNDMLANFQALLAGNIDVPLQLPLAVAINQSIPNGQSGFSVLNVAGNIDALLSLSDVGYDLNGTVPQVLVPEPSTLVMGTFAMMALSVFGWRRRK